VFDIRGIQNKGPKGDDIPTHYLISSDHLMEETVRTAGGKEIWRGATLAKRHKVWKALFKIFPKELEAKVMNQMLAAFDDEILREVVGAMHTREGKQLAMWSGWWKVQAEIGRSHLTRIPGISQVGVRRSRI
jgi:hypothetical protein